MALWIVAGCISGIAGPALRGSLVSVGYPQDSLVAVIQDIFLLGWCLALVNLTRSASDLRVLLTAWVWGSAFWAALMVAGVELGIRALSGIETGNGIRAEGNFGDPNMAANYFALSILVLWSSATPRNRWVRAAIGGLLLVAMVLTGSNGAFLNLGIGVTFVALAALRRRFGPTVLLVVTSLGLVTGAAAIQLFDVGQIQVAARDSGVPILHDWIGRSDSSASERLVILQETWDLFQQAGPLGTGPNATKPLLTDTLAPYAHQAHDDYVAAVVERGVVGGLAILALVCTIWFRSAGALGGRLRPDFASVVPRREPLVGAMLGLAAAAAYYEVMHFRHVWALLAVIAVVQIRGREVAPR
jgi:O-antigen ligase